MSRRRYVARGDLAAGAIGNKTRRWRGDHYEVRPDELVTELNGAGDCEQITALLKRYRALKR